MARTVGIGIQSFEKIIENNCFYIDKTYFIKEWWENKDEVTLITRPRRFGKTLNMNMLERFFSVEYSGQGQVFEGLSIWGDGRYRNLQGTYPVIALSFADVKEMSFVEAKRKICQIIKMIYDKNRFLLDGVLLTESDKKDFLKMIHTLDMGEDNTSLSLKILSLYLSRYYGKEVIILLDEYDTPMQEAYVYGYWDELTGFIRSLFNSTFKTNPYMHRAVMTGITRISKESVFSDLNNLEVVTTTSEKYEDCFGFTQEEVWEALRECGLYEERQKVREWYDGFAFGKKRAIYNPWSVLNYLDKKRLSPYWANTSSNSLVDKLIREGDSGIKMIMEDLLNGETFKIRIDEQIVFEQLENQNEAIWSLLLAGGYLRVEGFRTDEEWGEEEYELGLTNKEVRVMFRQMVRGWFSKSASRYNEFIRALLCDDVDAMNVYMNEVALHTFSSFDTGKKPSKEDPERFYHGFVLGLIVDLLGRYIILSNRESGFGRYDVVLEPCDIQDPAIILEFKVFNPGREKALEETVKAALKQIEEKKYAADLEKKGIDPGRIRKYGFAFEGKKVLIGKKMS